MSYGATYPGGYSVKRLVHTTGGGFKAWIVGGRTHDGDLTQKTGSKKLTIVGASARDLLEDQEVQREAVAEVPEHFELVEQAIGTPELVDLLGRRPRRFRSRRSNMSWQPEPPALLLCPPARSARARVAMECVRVSSVVSDRFLKVVPVIERPGAKGGGSYIRPGAVWRRRRQLWPTITRTPR